MEPLQATLCPKFHHAVELIGRRWAGAIIQLLTGGRLRYAALKGGIPAITDRMLSERLKELEAEGIVRRIVTPETPVRVEYELTKKGRDLEAALAAIGRWGATWVTPSQAKPARGRRSA